MASSQPVAVYAMRIPPGDVMIPAVPEFAATFRLTMAAIDPSAEPELEDADDKRPPRATLKLVRFVDDDFTDESDDEGYLNEDDEEDSDDEENGGPSKKKSTKLKLLEALAAEEEDEEDEEDDEDTDMDDDEEDDGTAAADMIKTLLKQDKGKGKALEGEDDDEDDEDDESDESLELDEVVLCTLDPEKHYQQTMDFVVGEGERIFFKVSGTHAVHLTGNYIIPVDDRQASLYDEDDEESYDLSPDEDILDALEDEDEESDELDDIDDPRITEVASDEDSAIKAVIAPKGKNKRPADDSDAEDLDALVAKTIKKEEPVVNGEAKKLTKAEKKAAKKLKKNDGEAVSAATPDKKPEPNVNGSEKKTVQFAKNLEQGPTPSATPPVKKEEAKKEEPKKAGNNSATVGVRNVNGVTVDDRKIGNGPGAKKSNKVEMRYIGKLENGKVFDSNKSGKPFAFKLGSGEVIKGWDIGLEGISAGGERRITIPAHLAYGKKALPGIPANSKLIFDVKCLSVK